MSMMDAESLDKSTAMWASLAYVLADLETKIPHDPPQNDTGIVPLNTTEASHIEDDSFSLEDLMD